MTTTWLFRPHTKTKHNPKIRGQIFSISDSHLILRNPWVTDSVFMGKLYTAMTVAFGILMYPDIASESYRNILTSSMHSLAQYILAPFMFTPFLAYRIYWIKKLSNFHFNRITQKVYYRRINKIIIFDWKTLGGGVFSRTEFGGASASTQYALAFAPPRDDGTFHQSDCLWVDSNEPTDAEVAHVAEVWEYLRLFMDKGPDQLPPPGEPNWWHKPLHAICLTPKEAWQHYAPWRTGEPGEMQGKKSWQLPFWAILFPYNLTVALVWYVICRLFNVRAATPPAEAFEEGAVAANKRTHK